MNECSNEWKSTHSTVFAVLGFHRAKDARETRDGSGGSSQFEKDI